MEKHNECKMNKMFNFLKKKKEKEIKRQLHKATWIILGSI